MEPILSNTGSVISSIYRNWEDFSLNWDSLSPNEDSELIGASSSELIAFGYEFNNIHSHWDATNNDWDAYQFLYASEGEDSSMVSTSPKFTPHVWHKYIYNWNLVELSWSDSFSFRKEKETTYIDSYFHRIPIKFNRWNSYFSSSSWVNENLASNIISSSDMWDGNDTLWNKNAVTWDSFHPPGAEVYTGPFLSVTRMDYSYGLWEGFVEKWNTAGNSWDDFSNQLEDVPTNQYHALVFDGVNSYVNIKNFNYDIRVTNPQGTNFSHIEINTVENAVSPEGVDEANSVASWQNNDVGGGAIPQPAEAGTLSLGNYEMMVQCAAAYRGVYVDLQGSDYNLEVGKTYRISWKWRYDLAHSNAHGFNAILSSNTAGDANQTIISTRKGNNSADQKHKHVTYDFVMSANTRYFHFKDMGSAGFVTQLKVDSFSLTEIVEQKAITIACWSKNRYVANQINPYNGAILTDSLRQTGLFASYYHNPTSSYQNNSMRFYALFGGVAGTGNQISHFFPYDNEEHFYVTTLNPTLVDGKYTARLYVDGKPANISQHTTASYEKLINVNDLYAILDIVRLGQDRTLTYRRPKITLRDIAVWDVDLSEEDVESLYNDGNPANLIDNNSYGSIATNRKDNLIGWWKMGEGLTTGDHTTVFDRSKNNNHANLIGFDSNPYISTHLTTTSNISPIYDYTNLSYNWDALNRNWDDFFLGVE